MTSTPTHAPGRPWHLSDRTLDPDRARERRRAAVGPFGAPSDAAPSGASDSPAYGSGGLDPVWKRVLSGRSFSWRIRRELRRARGLRRRVARAILRFLQLHPDLRRALYEGRPRDFVVGLAAAFRPRGRPARTQPRIASPIDLTDTGDVGAALADAFPGLVVVDPTRTVTAADLPAFRPALDLSVWNPAGLASHPATPVVRFSELCPVSATPTELGRLRNGRNAQEVVIDDVERPDDRVADHLEQLAASGGPLSGPVPPSVAELLDDRLVGAIEADYDSSDLRERQLHSVRVRRHALASASPRGRLTSLVERLAAPVDTAPHVAVLLPSNRPDDVVDAARAVGSQRGVRCELIVGLHGSHMPAALDAAVADAFPGPLTVVRLDDELVLGDVLNRLTDAVTAPVTTKWDDDDWYEPWHVLDLLLALEYSGAGLVGKAAEFVYLEAIDTTIRRFATGAERWSTTLAGGTLLAATDVVRSVGWRSIPRQVDRGLIDDLEARGYASYRTHGFGYVLRRRGGDLSGHTWRAGDAYFLGKATDQRTGLDLDFAGFDPESR